MAEAAQANLATGKGCGILKFRRNAKSNRATIGKAATKSTKNS